MTCGRCLLRRLRPPYTNSFEKSCLMRLFLNASPLIRTRLVRLAERSHLLLIAMAGMIEDGWSLGVLVNELTALYIPHCRKGIAADAAADLSMPTSLRASGVGGHIRTSSPSSPTGKHSCAIRCR